MSCPCTRSTASGSKRGSVSAALSSARLASRFSVSISAETPTPSSRASKSNRAASASRASAKPVASRSPEPSSSSPVIRLTAPSRPAGSSTAPPWKLTSMFSIGMVCSS